MTNLENIKSGEKYTLVIENSMGFVVSRQVKIVKAYLSDYTQYKDRLYLHYILKGKRKVEGTCYTDNKVAIVEGWKEVKGTIQDKNIDTFESFQDGNFDNIIKQNNLETVYVQ